MQPLHQNRWTGFRRILLILVVLIGGMSLLSLATGRPGDFQAGLIGGLIGSLGCAFVVVAEFVLRWRVKRAKQSFVEARGQTEFGHEAQHDSKGLEP
jgi:hypothetical protein